MRKYLSLFIFVIACGIPAYSQISITTTNTASICYNDGTLTINATGGTAPYTDSILSGPSNSNLTYPIALPTGQNVFTDLPHGTFTIVVHDAAGHSGTFTASVGGTYEFPTMTFDTTAIPGIICIASAGLPPYQYAISSTGSDSGFGSYQSSDTFANYCPGRYWIRMRDSCQNIFTKLVTFSYHINDNNTCINFSKGTITAIVSGGHPPYTYSFRYYNFPLPTVTSSNGIFTGLAPYFYGNLVITDSCGVSTNIVATPVTVQLAETCPFDSNIHYVNQFIINGPNFGAYTYTCTNCTPPQTVNGSQLLSDTIFHHVSPNYNYNIVIINPACGGDTIPYVLTFPTPSPYVGTRLDCNSFYVVPASGTDSAVALLDSTGTIIEVSDSGYFFNLPDGNYTVEPYGYSPDNSCIKPTSVSVPYFSGFCEVLMMDSTCQQKWSINTTTGEPLSDIYSIIYGVGDTIRSQINNLESGQIFFLLNPEATYTMLSNKGCSTQITLDSLPHLTSLNFSSTPCVGLPSIQGEQGLNYNNDCSLLYVTIYTHDSLVYTSISNPNPDFFDGYNLTISDSGWYTVKWYLYSVDTSSNISYYDNTLCPIDTSVIYVSLSHVPFPYVPTAYKCNGILSSPPLLTIYGGEIPYTVQIPGVDTITMNTNTSVFPDTAVGTYNVIAYDNCGISRSFTFTILDTCGCRPPASLINTSHTGFTYQFLDSITSGTGPFTYSWSFGDGSPDAYTSNPTHTYIPNPARNNYTVTLIVTGSCGSDTLTEVVTIVTGIQDIELAEHVSVYPNPNEGSFTIAVNGISSATLTTEVTDILGRSVYKQNIHTGENKLDLSLTSGIYTVQISDGNTSTVRMMTIK